MRTRSRMLRSAVVSHASSLTAIVLAGEEVNHRGCCVCGCEDAAAVWGGGQQVERVGATSRLSVAMPTVESHECDGCVSDDARCACECLTPQVESGRRLAAGDQRAIALRQFGQQATACQARSRPAHDSGLRTSGHALAVRRMTARCFALSFLFPLAQRQSSDSHSGPVAPSGVMTAE